MSEEHQHMETKVIHAAPHKDQFGALIPPIYQTSTFIFDNAEQGGDRFAGVDDGFKYTRLGNPSIYFLENRIAELESGKAGCVAASGMGAISSTVLTLLRSGDHLLSDDTLYGCTHSLFEEQLTKFGVQVDFVNMAIPGEVTKHIKPNTKIVYFETPGNPTMKIIDIERVAKEAHEAKPDVRVIVDNTFCSPIITRPLEHGADIVLHSMTKYLNGHTDVVGGVIVSRDEKVINDIKNNGIKDLTGAVLSPHDAFLVLRGLMTLDLRVNKACENAHKVADYLVKNPKVSHVYYPGLETHPNHEIAKKQMGKFGSMISFDMKDGFDAAKKLLNNLKIIALAVSLGGCESLIQHPASMTHLCIPKEEREACGLTDGLIRLSVGVEHVDDLIDDLEQAFAKV